MNIIEFHSTDQKLEIAINCLFDIWVRRMIQRQLTPEINTLTFDLTGCDLMDSEAVIFIYQWIKSGKQIRLINPPKIYFEIWDILELTDEIQPDYTITKDHHDEE